MLNILLFITVFILPGASILWLTRAKWALKLEFCPGGSIWLAIPTSFAISISIISILGWGGFFLKLNFVEVKFIFLAIIGFLFLVSGIKLWQKRQRAFRDTSVPLYKRLSLKNLELFTAIFIIIVLLLTIYGGTWFSHTADSLNHMAAVRSIIKYNNPVPMQIYWPEPVTGMDPTFGTWHLALAIWKSISGIELPTMWLLATILLAPMVVLSNIVLALELTQDKFVAFLSGLFYVIVGISGDFRSMSYSNKMGQIFLWLTFVFILLSIRAYHSRENRSKFKYFLVLIALFGWTSAAIHQQYPPALLGVAIPSLVIIIFAALIKKITPADHSADGGRSSIKPILYTGMAVLLPTAFGFFIRSYFTISEKYPLLRQSVEALQTTSKLTLIQEDLNTWFSSWNSYITIATILSLTLIYYLFREKLTIRSGVIFIVISSILVPLYVILMTLFIGRGGLLLSVFNRLKLLMPAFLLIGWVWALVVQMRSVRAVIKKFHFRKLPTLLIAVIVLGVSIYSISMRVTNPNGGIISLYSPQSTYKFGLASSRNSNLYITRGDAVQFIDKLPDDTRILADEGTGYEMAGLTGKLFIRLPSQHTPLQEKNLNDAARQDAKDFVSGKLNNSQMVEILLRQKVDYIYVDRERYNGPKLWNILPTLPVLDEVASGGSWRIYQVMPEQAEAYIALDEKIRETDDFFQKIALYKSLESMFPNQERYLNELQRVIPVDPAVLVDFVNEGPSYTNPQPSGVAFDFLHNLDAALIVSAQTNTVHRTAYVIKRDARGVIFQHPDSQLIYTVVVPQESSLDFSIALDPAVWELGKGDGVEFMISVEKNEKQLKIFDEYIDPKNNRADRKWFDFSVDLSAYGGEIVKIIFETRLGPQQDNRFDWAGWGEPRLRQQVEYDLLENWENLSIQSETPVMVKKTSLKIDDNKRYILFQHPISAVTADVSLPRNPELSFGIGIDPEALKNHKSDGIEFNVYIIDQKISDDKILIYSQYLDPNDEQFRPTWHDVILDLSKYGGDDVKIIFETLPGSANNSDYDWGGWSSPVIKLQPRSVRQLSDPMYMYCRFEQCLSRFVSKE